MLHSFRQKKRNRFYSFATTLFYNFINFCIRIPIHNKNAFSSAALNIIICTVCSSKNRPSSSPSCELHTFESRQPTSSVRCVTLYLFYKSHPNHKSFSLLFGYRIKPKIQSKSNALSVNVTFSVNKMGIRNAAKLLQYEIRTMSIIQGSPKNIQSRISNKS